MARVRLAFLGPPHLEVDGAPVQLDTRKAIALAAYLAVTAEPASRDSLVTLLWSRYGRAGGHAALRRTLSTMRASLGPAVLRTEREAVCLTDSPELWLDIARFRELVTLCDGHAHGPKGFCRACLPLLGEATGILRGTFLSGFTLKDSVEFDDWQFFVTEQIRQESARALERMCLCAAAADDLPAAVGWARQRLGLDRLDESAHAMLMRLYAWQGNRAAVKRQYEECARLLDGELSCAPDPPLAAWRRRSGVVSSRARPVFTAQSAVAVSGPLQQRAEREELFAETGVATVLFLQAVPGLEARVAEGSFETCAAEAVEKHHGRLIERGAAAVTAVFGDGRSMESNPELAIRAALEAKTTGHGRAEAARGAVATGRLSRRKSATGAAPGTVYEGRALQAARAIGERSPASGILVDEHTWRLTRNAFVFSPAGSSTFLVRGVAAFSRKSRGGASPRAEMVGREEESRRLAAALEKSAAGKGQVVVITGEAGIGKSRLVGELHAAAAPSIAEGALCWLEGRCLAPNTNVGYWPFIDMVDALRSRRPGSSPRMDPGSAAGSLDLLLQTERIDGLPQNVAPLAAAAQELLENSSAGPHGKEISQWSPEQVKHRTFGVVRLLFDALAAERPLILVFEDLHWADTLSLELIDFLIDSLRGRRAFLVLVYRVDPGHRSRNLAASAARRRIEDLTEIPLREITREESSRLLTALVPQENLPEPARQEILQRCRGNPYFLEELARATESAPDAADTDGPASETGRAEVEGAPNLTQGIKSVVLTRFYNLSETARQVLSCAAVIGRVFPLRLLGLAMNRQDLGSILEDLEDRELLFLERSVPDLEYSFKHVLAQEAIYEGLDASTRAELHRTVARAYEQLSPTAREDYCESLAYHYDRGHAFQKAIDYYYLSGEKARKAYANSTAVTHFTRGLALLRSGASSGASLDRELDFLTAVGVPLVLTKGHHDPEVETVHLRAKAIGEARGTLEQLCVANLGLVRYYGYSRKRLEYAQQMLEIAEKMGDPFWISRAHMMLSESWFYVGDFEEMRRHTEEMGRLLDPDHSPRDLVRFGNSTAVGCLILRSRRCGSRDSRTRPPRRSRRRCGPPGS